MHSSSNLSNLSDTIICNPLDFLTQKKKLPTFPSPRPCLIDRPHGQLDNDKGTSTDRHGPQQGRPNALDEAPRAVGPPHLAEAVAHALVLLRGAEAVGLHLALDDVKGVARQPEHLAGEAAVQGDLPGGNGLAVDIVARRVRVHHVLKRREPRAVRKRLAEQRHGCASVQALGDAVVRADLADAVQGPVVQLARAVRLALQTDADVLDRAGQHRVGQAGEGTGGKVLVVAQVALFAGRLVALLEGAAGLVEGAELDGDAGADADERREGALVEGEAALVLVDGGGGVEGRRVLGRCLEADFDDVEGLAYGGNGVLVDCEYDGVRRDGLKICFFHSCRHLLGIGSGVDLIFIASDLRSPPPSYLKNEARAAASPDHLSHPKTPKKVK